MALPDERTPAFYEAAFERARPQIERIRAQIPRFPAPVLRVQRVGQLDADLLDQELTDLLAEPLKAALQKVHPAQERQRHAELYLLLRLLLYKFSIYDRSASYGAMLQNLKYRNEWVHRAHRAHAGTSTARDAPLSPIQLGLYPLLTIVLPYLYGKGRSYMTSHQYDQAPRESPQFVVYSLADHAHRLWNLVALLNFALFLWNGKYRTVTDRVLGMRLTYANRSLQRNVSFEFLNRQLVWNAFTEFLLFLLPLIKPQRVLRRMARWPSHPVVLGALHDTLPERLSRRLGLVKDDEDGVVRLASRARKRTYGKYWYLPKECCALCFERLERAAGVDVDHVSIPPPHATLPNPDPLHPNKGLVATRQKRDQSAAEQVSQRASERAQRLEARRAARKAATASRSADHEPTLEDTSPNGIKYMDAILVTPYQTLPCAQKGRSCQYCYYCIADKLLDEDMGEDLQAGGGWACLRCGDYVYGAERVVVEST
ncbi:peroxisome assembly protein (Peroxin-2) [Malassezia caprae]|uniref:RING-type E3 ubiquitin transferase (cysteine targeting) n=1 Tax=Malassezia caprae TaxID=1381934 RepID=A0AAF0E880_9BASI|nr:peroxisome assembly protein (Peroxin-2) [Malassezia caprae]